MSFVLLVASLLFSSVNGGEGGSRYFLYSVKHGEGFNLRRDVHMRAATLVKSLRDRTGEDWTLVLPPWPLLPHWKTAGKKSHRTNLKWGGFFDLPSLSEYVPSIEFEEFVHKEGKKIGTVLRLQHDFTTEWKEKADKVSCSDPPSSYKQMKDGSWKADLFGVEGVAVATRSCLAVMGFTKTLLPLLLEVRSTSVLVESLEVVMHSQFGGVDYWQSRSSMVYAHHLREEGNGFMSSYLKYSPGEGRGREAAKGGGGDYLSVHLRRGDYLYARPNDIPSVSGAANQINILLQRHDLDTVFLATDAPSKDKQELKSLVNGHVMWYTPSSSFLGRYGDGGVAITDQWIAAHGRVFVGSFESTFSFRIREDRQLMDFSKESTFNQLCGTKDNENNPSSCTPPTYWKMPEGIHGTKKSFSSKKQSEL